MKKLLFVSFCFILLFSCSKQENNEKNYSVDLKNGINIFKNTKKPSVKNLKIMLNEISTINGTSEIVDSDFFQPNINTVDKYGNVYIFDKTSSAIKKFDRNGKFLFKFGRLGTGPGEYQQVQQGGLIAINDEFYIVNSPAQKIVVFDKDGNYLKDIALSIFSSGIPANLISINDKFIGYMIVVSPPKDGKIGMKFSLSILDIDFKLLKEITSFDLELDLQNMGKFMANMANEIPIFTTSNDKIYIAKKGVDDFEISVFDFDGKKLAVVDKPYRKIKYQKEELELINNAINKSIPEEAKAFMGNIKFDQEFKKAIELVLFDKKSNYLLTQTAYEKNIDLNSNILKYDIFKNNIYLNTVDIKLEKNENIFRMENNIIYTANTDEDNIKLYEYSFSE